MSDPSLSPVRSLVSKHEESIRRASPQPPRNNSTSPSQTRRSLPGGTEDVAQDVTEEEQQQPESPTALKGNKELPKTEGDLLAADSSSSSSATTGDNASTPASSTVLGDIQEEGAAKDSSSSSKEGEGEVSEKTQDKPAAAAEGEAEDKAEGAEEAVPAAAATGDAPLTAILKGLEALPEKEQAKVKENLERIAEYPKELPLSASWTLHFSDTSGASKSSSAAVTKDAYTDGINKVFTATTVPGLCGSLKAYKEAVKSLSKRVKPEDGLGLYRAGMNLHFFRTGISPTWEDAYNAKGGRITISPHANIFDAVYERLVLLLAGAVLEIQAAENVKEGASGEVKLGLINGVVASRRARGDRIELWLGGSQKQQAPPTEWIDRLKQSLAVELELPELANSKYKRHF